MNKNIFSKEWRLNNLYTIRDKLGVKRILKLNNAQKKILQYKHNRKIILKSRQQGISTFYLAYNLDDCLVIPGYNAGIQSYGQDEAEKLATRAKLMWDELDEDAKTFIGLTTIGKPLELVKCNSKVMEWNNGSVLKIGNFRGDTLQSLHVSELGKIAKKFPDKAKELKTGAFQAVSKENKITIESTAEGRTGLFYEMWRKAEEIQLLGKELTPLDFQAIFLSWLEDTDCNLDYEVEIPEHLQKYFEKIEKELNVKLADTQKWWYVKKYEELGDDIKQEYPTTAEEAFTATKDGSYWSKLYRDLIVKRKRLITPLYDKNLPVNVAIDLGINDVMVLVFYQFYVTSAEPELRIIDEYHNEGEGLEHYVKVLNDKKYNYKDIFVPHDANVRELGTGKSRLTILRELGVNAKVLPRQPVQDGIELVRKWIKYMWIDDRLTYIKETFVNYTKEWNERLGTWSSKPLHNEWSHPADAIRYMCLSLPNISKYDNYNKVKRKSGGIDL